MTRVPVPPPSIPRRYAGRWSLFGLEGAGGECEVRVESFFSRGRSA